MRIRNHVHLSLILTLSAMSCASLTASGATVTWTGASSNVWNSGATGNWTGGAGTDFTNLDNVVFNDAGANKSITVAGPVVPGTLTFNNTSGVANNYTFSTNAVNTIGGSGGTTITSSGTVIYSPTNAGAHSFGTGAIQLNAAGSVFAYTPTTAGSTLTNNFVINAPVTWYRHSTNGTRTGTVTVNSNFNLSSDFVTQGVMESTMLLTGDRTVSGSTYALIPTISGQVTSSGVKRSITINNTGNNPGWFFDISSPGTTAWDIKDLILNSGGNREATTRVTSDERNFFTSMEANGGYLRIMTAGPQFTRAANAEIGFDIIITPQTAGAGTEYGTGIRGNTAFTVVSGGGLHGTGIYRSGAPSCCEGGSVPYSSPLDVSVSGTGLISPGEPTLVNTAGVLTINGDLAFAGGQLRIDVRSGGGVAGTDFDRLVVQDAPAVGSDGVVTGIGSATLVVDFHNLLFADLEGDVLTILTSSLTNFTGQQFGTVTTLNTSDYYVNVLYGSGFIQLALVSTIPEPSTFGLLGLGVIGLAIRTRRRRAAA